jgi:hypothetical protein
VTVSVAVTVSVSVAVTVSVSVAVTVSVSVAVTVSVSVAVTVTVSVSVAVTVSVSVAVTVSVAAACSAWRFRFRYRLGRGCCFRAARGSPLPLAKAELRTIGRAGFCTSRPRSSLAPLPRAAARSMVHRSRITRDRERGQ